MNNSRGQGGLEYLLLIAAAAITAVVVIVILVQSNNSAGGLLGESVNSYSNELNAPTVLSAVFGGGDDGGGGPTLPVCGNGILESGETCDNQSLSCDASGYPGTQVCLPDCSNYGVCTTPLFCGDGICNGPETSSCSDCFNGAPVPTLALSAGDKLAMATFSAIDPEGDPSLTYTLLFATNQANLDAVQVTGPTNSFDSLPPNVFLVTPTSTIPGTNIYAPFAGSLSVSNLTNGNTVYFRLRACDSLGNCQATFPSQSAVPIHKTVSVSVGADEIVYDWSVKKCTNLDIPDNPARFFRTASGITLIAANAPNVYIAKSANFTATNLNNGHVCPPTAPVSLVSTNNLEAYSFDNYEWLWSTYKEGSTVHAIVHNEFHDGHAYADPPCKTGDPTPSNKCWYNTLTYASSTNDGTTFTQPSSPTAKLIAAGPDPWNYAAITTPTPLTSYEFYGYQGGTSIIKRSDGYYYDIFYRELNPNGGTGLDPGYCIMRTNNLSDPSSWRAWDGKAYTITLSAPYNYSTPTPTPASTGIAPCAFISFTNQFYPRGLTYNTYLGQYIIVGEGVVGSQCGAYFSLSHDLITWSTPYFLKSGKVGYGPCAGGGLVGLTPYPTLIDHTDTSVNFEYTGQNGFVYHSLWNSNTTTDVDLIRAPVTFNAP